MFKRILPCLVLVSSMSFAGGIQSINNFVKDKNSSISANFTQTVYGVKKNTISTGTMEISRPNKFRWQYANQKGVSGQLIMSDGKLIYVYDKDLAQVTEKKLTKSLDRSPALLLAGGVDLNKVYNTKVLPSSDGLDWVSLIPKKVNDNNGFKLVQIAFKKNTSILAEMKFTDSFDNKSSIVFSDVKTLVKFPVNEFKFLVPAGTDIIKSDN
jgi:outer membrane lipoprotein carrier protein